MVHAKSEKLFNSIIKLKKKIILLHLKYICHIIWFYFKMHTEMVMKEKHIDI